MIVRCKVRFSAGLITANVIHCIVYSSSTNWDGGTR